MALTVAWQHSLPGCRIVPNHEDGTGKLGTRDTAKLISTSYFKKKNLKEQWSKIIQVAVH
jgi:hypothetical protein